ncbi:hypothetical protein L1987_88443 [Smallanthus sonchifolius]|nr:hypothetical protein L1987_88443 [Smallanthus sonchifolius]
MPDFFSLMLLSSVSCFYKAFRDSTYCDPKCSLYVQAFKPELVFLPPSYFTSLLSRTPLSPIFSLHETFSFYPIEAVVPIATVLRPLVGVLSAALAVEFFLISSATSRGLLTRLCFLSGPLLNKKRWKEICAKGFLWASLLLLLELHKKDGSGEKSYPQAFAYRMVKIIGKREEQGRRSFLKEDDSKINSKRRIGCLKEATLLSKRRPWARKQEAMAFALVGAIKHLRLLHFSAGQKSGNFLRDALLRYDAPFFEVDSPRSNDKEPKAKMAAEESDG